ncbi:MAG: hypothetical protein P8P26_06085 [Porticoccaceae bacterium]|nr:hypothetical protein [Porticoccaceae bacterium]
MSEANFNHRQLHESPLTTLALTATLGIFWGLVEAYHPTDHGLSKSIDRLDSSLAQVNGTAIRHRDYQRALKLFASGKRGQLNSEDRQLVLERLIQEELLVQYAISTDLPRRNQKLRTALLQSVLAGLDIEARAIAPDSRMNNGLEAYLTQLRNNADIQRGQN